MPKFHFSITLAGEFDVVDIFSAQTIVDKMTRLAISSNEDIIYDIDKRIGKVRGAVALADKESWQDD